MSTTQAHPAALHGRRSRSSVRDAPSVVTGAAADVALLVMVVLTFLLVLVADERANILDPPSRAGFPSWLSGPLGGLLPGVDLSTTTLRWGFSIVMVVMFGCYLVALAGAREVNVRWAVTAVVLAHVVLVLSPPLLLTDAFNYLNYGRMEIVHHLDPYVQIPAVEPHVDPAFGFSNWHHLLSPYGPLFTLYTYLLVPLGLAASFWVLKLTIAAVSLGTLALLWRCAEMVGRPPLHAFLFVGANPLVLIWGLGGDHNDFFMVGFLVLAIYLLLRASEAPSRWMQRGAGAALVGAIAIKASAGILAPAILAGTRRRRGLAEGLAVAGAVAATTTLLTFGVLLPNLADQSQVVTGVGLPNLLGYFLGLGGESDALRAVLDVVLVAAVVGFCVRAVRTHDWITAAGGSMLALLLTLSWELPWYVFWLLPFAVLSRSRALRTAALALGAYLILAWVPITNDVINSVNFKPTATQLGLRHSRLTSRLLH